MLNKSYSMVKFIAPNFRPMSHEAPMYNTVLGYTLPCPMILLSSSDWITVFLMKLVTALTQSLVGNSVQYRKLLIEYLL